MIPQFLIKPIIGIALVAIVFTVGLGLGWSKATESVENKYKARIAQLEIDAQKETIRVVTRYVDRINTVEVQGETIIKEVPVYVPFTTPDLPGGFRVLHDAAVTGQIPEAARVADAATVPAQDAAGTVIGNYTTCRATAEQLIALQDWIRGVSR
jgi:hypothetical protein